jgi:hypothetical protein
MTSKKSKAKALTQRTLRKNAKVATAVRAL